MFQINGIELNFDATDADTLNRYITAMDSCSEKSSEIKEPGNDKKKLVETYRKMCGNIKTVFDDIFGEGTGNKVCGQNDSVLECQKAYLALAEEYNRQMEESEELNNAIEKAIGKK